MLRILYYVENYVHLSSYGSPLGN